MPVYFSQEADIGERIDVYLARGGTLSRSALARLLKGGGVLVNGRPVQKSYRLSGGEEIAVNIPEPAPSAAKPENIPLDILYEDGHLLVINKPRGLVVHPGSGNPTGTLVNALLNHCGEELSGIGGVTRPGIVHRLDKDTPGLMLAAKNDFTHNALCAALQRREITRKYICIVRGTPKPESGVIEAPIGRHPSKRTRMAVVPDGRPALTRYRLLEEYSGYSRAECTLDTGRTHQIRVHMAHIGHPILGDLLYGGGKGINGWNTQMLQAYKLGFRHPVTGEELKFVAECLF
ncbi:MAG: RluA family pseudouridine synthase [Oscillospiraceae bacterium]|nr:RluA family pseudouridine synthase [Oscillospiraceae bacterium]